MRLTPLPSLVVPDIWGKWQGFVEIEPLVSGSQEDDCETDKVSL